MGSTVTFKGVVIKARSDCTNGCYTDLTTAQVLVGSKAWAGPSSLPGYTLCGSVPDTIIRGARIGIECSAPITGRYLTVYLVKEATALTLCQVDVILA